MGALGGIIIVCNGDIYNLVDTVEGIFTLTTVLSRKMDVWQQIVTLVYGPNDQHRRPDLWREIKGVREQSNMPWIIGGDFDAVRFMDEQRGGDSNHREKELFDEVIND